MSYKHRVLLFDTEVGPMLTRSWSAAPEFIPSHMLEHDRFILCWAAKWEGASKIYSGKLTVGESKEHDDRRIVAALADLIREADAVVAHSGDRHDLPIVSARLAAGQLEPLGPFRSIDTYKLAKRHFSFAYNSLGYLADALEVEHRKGYTPGGTWRRAYHGDASAMRTLVRYCRQDVRTLEAVFEAMRPYVKLPRLVDASADGEDACCEFPHLQKRGFHRTSAGTFQRYACTSCGLWSRDRASIKSKRTRTVPL